MPNITKLYPKGAAKKPDNVLEQAVGKFKRVLVVGIDTEGEFDMRASTNMSSGEACALSLRAANSLSCVASWEIEDE